MGIKEYLNGKDDGITRRNMLKALGAGAATATTAGCITNGKTTEPTSTTTETQTPNTTEDPRTTEQNTTTESEPEYPVEIEPKIEEVDLQRVYENSIETPTDFNNRMRKATHDEIDAEGLDNIAAEFEGDRTQQLKHVTTAAAGEYRSRTQSNQAIVKAAHDTFDWFNYENGARADIETFFEGGQSKGPATVLTYRDENGELQNKLMFGIGIHTLSDDWKDDYQNSEYMQAENDLQFAAMDFRLFGRTDDEVSERWYKRFNKGLDNFLWGNHYGTGNLVTQPENGGVELTQAILESPKSARDVKDEVNAAYAKAEQEYNIDHTDGVLRIKPGTEPEEDIMYEIVSEDMAEKIRRGHSL